MGYTIDVGQSLRLKCFSCGEVFILKDDPGTKSEIEFCPMCGIYLLGDENVKTIDEALLNLKEALKRFKDNSYLPALQHTLRDVLDTMDIPLNHNERLALRKRALRISERREKKEGI